MPLSKVMFRKILSAPVSVLYLGLENDATECGHVLEDAPPPSTVRLLYLGLENDATEWGHVQEDAPPPTVSVLYLCLENSTEQAHIQEDAPPTVSVLYLCLENSTDWKHV